MLKWNRNYKLSMDIGEIVQSKTGIDSTGKPIYQYEYDKPVFTETIEIAYPFTLNFSVKRDVYSQVNTAYFQILGLNENTRAKLYKDRDNVRKFIRIRFNAGYGDNTPLCFNGTIKECYSYKESGGTEFKTEIEAWDGGFGIYWAHTNKTLSRDVSSTDILNILTADFKVIELGGISDNIKIPQTNRDHVFIGRTWDCVRSYVNNNLFVDNERIFYMMTEEDVRQGEIMSLDVDTGLLASPRRRDTVIEVGLLFEPRVVLGQQISLTSQTVPYLNGTYKIIGIQHDGTISGAVGGRLRTTLSLFIGTKIFNQIKELNRGVT